MIRLDRQWDGAPAPAAAAGSARLDVTPTEMILSWDLRSREPLRLPGSPAGFLDGLWEHDVIELFLAPARLPPGPPRYLELEAGPGGHWLALDLRDVRLRGAELRDLSPTVTNTSSHHEASWQGRLRVDLLAVTRIVGPRPWRGLVAAVLGGSTMSRVYLTSSPLPGDHPNFHQPHAWPLLP